MFDFGLLCIGQSCSVSRHLLTSLYIMKQRWKTGRLEGWKAGRGRSDAQSMSILYHNQMYQSIRSIFIAHTNTFQVECISPGFHSKYFGHLILVSCISAILGKNEPSFKRCGHGTLKVRPRSLCYMLFISRYRWPYRRNKVSLTTLYLYHLIY